MDEADLLVVGGGINGSAIARDAAGRGLGVLLVEQGDLAQGTSSASTKLIHGGLRYLEQREFRLVRESLRERATMLRSAPHLVRPLRFILPHSDDVRPWRTVRAGLWLYDLFAIGGGLPRSRAVRIDDPDLAEDAPARGFAYWDAWVDDARLVVLNARDAADRGATVRTRTRLVSARREGDRWRAELADAGGGTATVGARAIVNAAGPWVEEVLRGRLDSAGDNHARLIKGSHIVVPRLFAGEDAWLLQQPDRRVVFAIPYEQAFTLIGTTDVPWDGPPGGARIEPDEIDYLCAAANRAFRRQISSTDVQWAFSGVRALRDDGSAQASEVTRDYALELDGDGAPLLSVFGGKITTARALAEEAVDRLVQAGLAAGKAWTRGARLPGGDIARFDRALKAARKRWPFLGEPQLVRLLRAYGSRLGDWLGAARSVEDLGEYFGAGLTAAEVDHLVAHEWARTAEDILWRRSKLGLHLEAQQAQRLADYVGTTAAPGAAPPAP